MERLDKLLAATGQWSRKEAKALVKAGRVQVGGARPKGPEDKVAEGTPVTVDGRPIATEQGVYVMLHKPAGVVSSTQDPRERTVLDLLPQHLRRRALFPVGRLDQQDRRAFQAGVTLADGTVCQPADLTVLDPPSQGLVTLREGKYHQVKRMLAARGKPVTYLKRLSMGPLTLDPALPAGAWRPLTPEEKASLGR